MCVGGFEADLKLILAPNNNWHSSYFGMGSGGSKKTDNVVADTVDFSTNMSKDFAVLRLNGGTSALVAGVAASAVLVYMAYRMFKWKKAQMDQARRRAPQGEGRVIWGGPGRVDMEGGEGQGRFARRLPAACRPPLHEAVLPLPVHVDVCDDCREEGYDVLRGHFQPQLQQPAAHPM